MKKHAITTSLLRLKQAVTGSHYEDDSCFEINMEKFNGNKYLVNKTLGLSFF